MGKDVKMTEQIIRIYITVKHELQDNGKDLGLSYKVLK